MIQKVQKFWILEVQVPTTFLSSDSRKHYFKIHLTAASQKRKEKIKHDQRYSSQTL